MFKIIESISPDPIRFPAKPEIKLTPGHIIKIIDYQGNLVVDLCDGSYAFGVVGNVVYGGSKLDFSKGSIAHVYPQRMVANIEKFDRKSDPVVGCSLYCNTKGMLSAKKPFENAIVLAKVIYLPSAEKKHMQILWL
jgi:hypothetical protein